MKAHRSLQNVVLEARGPVGMDRREPSAGRVRAKLARAILIPFLALVSLSAVAAASPGYGIEGHVRVSTHQAAGSSAMPAQVVAARSSCTLGGSPWMYAIANGRPWMYAVINGRPWMYAKVVNGGRWMYAKTNGRPGCTLPERIMRHGAVSA